MQARIMLQIVGNDGTVGGAGEIAVLTKVTERAEDLGLSAARRSGWQLIGNQDEMRGRCRFFLRGARAATV